VKGGMVGFSIGFTGFDDDDPSVAIGAISLKGGHERFESVLGFWELDDYKRSWIAGLRRLVSGASTSCLATSVTDPSSANFVEVWPLYREESDVYVQNQLLFLDQLPREFDPTEPWESVDPRSVVDEDGQRISEWRVSIDDIQEFLKLSSISQHPVRSE
jgi:CdiI N-terminal domain